MAKSWPDYMGTYKAMLLEWGITATKTKGLPQFVIRVILMEYYDQKQGEWFDVSENNWVMNAYLCLYGREGGEEDGDIVPTLNHQQVCKVFEWDGCGFEYLTTPARFDGKMIQVRVETNTGENAKTPVQINWVDTEDADPNSGLQKLDAGQVKELENKFSHLWKNKKTPAAVTVKKMTAKAPPQTVAAKTTKPPVSEPPAEEPPAETKEDKKKALLEKSKRLRAEAKKEPLKTAKPPAEEPPASDDSESAVPDDYGKKQAWNDIIELRDEKCTDEQQKKSWRAAIAEIAPDGDEDKLDAAGWYAVKETVVVDIGQF